MRFPILSFLMLAALPGMVAAAPARASVPPPGGDQMCLPAGIDSNPVAIDRGHLFFPRNSGAGTGWINSLRGGDCPGLDGFNTIVIERFSGQVCDGDRIRTIQPGLSIPGPVCILGRFTPATRPDPRTSRKRAR
jgi:hypothetical protein